MPTLTDKQALDFLSRLFPGGLRDPGLLAELCPEGWQASPLRLAFHPTDEQRYEEHLRWLKSPIHEISRRREGLPDPEEEPVPTFEEFLASEKPGPVFNSTDGQEFTELLGDCLWDILSNNHDLIDRNGDAVHFGSFRMVSGLIDDFLEDRAVDGNWRDGDHMRFYMGTSLIGHRTDLRPVYRLIFRRIRQLGYEWKYAFPRIHVVRFRKEPTNPADYDPSEAFAEEEKRRREDEEDRKQREAMARDLAEAKRRALDRAPPAVVLAYQEVYGTDPHGWPPDPDSPD